jgi:hypothetical protein
MFFMYEIGTDKCALLSHLSDCSSIVGAPSIPLFEAVIIIYGKHQQWRKTDKCALLSHLSDCSSIVGAPSIPLFEAVIIYGKHQQWRKDCYRILQIAVRLLVLPHYRYSKQPLFTGNTNNGVWAPTIEVYIFRWRNIKKSRLLAGIFLCCTIITSSKPSPKSSRFFCL